MTALFIALLPTLLKIVGFFIDRSGADEEETKSYLAFISKSNKRRKAPIRLHKSYQKQLEELEKLDQANLALSKNTTEG